MCTVKMGKNLHVKLQAKASVVALGLATLFVSAKVAMVSSDTVAVAGFCGLLGAFAGFCGLLRALLWALLRGFCGAFAGAVVGCFLSL